MPESRDLASRHPRGRRRTAERVTGKRRSDDRERVGGSAPCLPAPTIFRG